VRLLQRLRPPGVLAIALSCVWQARAETLSGTVVDPQQRVFSGAQVTLICGRSTDTRHTDAQGQFTFTRQEFPAACKIRALYPGFAELEVQVGRQRSFLLQLHIAEIKQAIAADPGKLSTAPLESVSLSAEDLLQISSDTDDLLSYARHLAGIFSGLDRIYVDGLPADHPPPTDRIASIAINADPFSAEFSDGGDNHIDITTKKPQRIFRITSLGTTFGTSQPDGLNPALSSTSTTARLGLAGPIPYLPLGFTSNIDYSGRHAEQPIEAVIPVLLGSTITPVDSVTEASQNILFGIAAGYVRNENLRIDTSLYIATARHSNLGAGATTLPQSAVSQDSNGRELRTTFVSNGPHYVYRGGFTLDWTSSTIAANSTAMGVTVSGAFIAGGAQLATQSTGWNRISMKHVLQFTRLKRTWTIGASVSRRADRETVVPNSFGQITFDNLSDYTQSATTGAALGTGILTQGQGSIGYVSYTGAPFIETEILHKPSLALRAGLRADVQTGGGILVSPRLSISALNHGFILNAGGGMFVHDWTNDIFLRVLQNNGQLLQQYLVLNASLSGLNPTTAVAQPQIVAATQPNLTPPRDWISRVSLEHPFKTFIPGIETTFTTSDHLLGSQRLNSPSGWTDWLASNRAQQSEKIHLRAQFRLFGQSLTAHYEWIHSRDDTDGPFSFPAVQNDIRAEWAPSSSIAAHNLSLVANSKIGKALSLTLLDSWHSPLPLNYTSGLDPENNGLYTDRAGLPRNSGSGAFYNSMTLFAHRTVQLPKLFLPPGRKMFLDLNGQVLNLFGNKDYSSFGTVLGSALLGLPLAAAPGRSFRFSINFSR